MHLGNCQSSSHEDEEEDYVTKLAYIFSSIAYILVIRANKPRYGIITCRKINGINSCGALLGDDVAAAAAASLLIGRRHEVGRRSIAALLQQVTSALGAVIDPLRRPRTGYRGHLLELTATTAAAAVDEVI
ncbi:hypothetical protein TSAR_005864 [Trichomalopsis sarcophagae]|uniref:Uncharacterized protein n=1 Tax=Trichomalopsis sarcophagae TaxID=543379 RepID=A0A232FLF1_9HYME|nr:hypothetical protein TSAR_005864 [Trichomalopsis sarcophagae]